MTEIQGRCDERFGAVQEAFAANLEAGLEVGASVAVRLEGEPVVDLWGGTTWAADTITNVWSTTKTMANLCALILADRGELDLHRSVAHYWPGFEAEGKAGIEVRHLLGHTAGLPGWTEPMRPSDLYDWDLCCERLARQAPWWEPGTAAGYHGVTQGYLVGEVVRRVTGRSLGTFFRDEVAVPLAADFHIGLDPAHDHRVAPAVAPPTPLVPEGVAADSMLVRALGNPFLAPEQSGEPGWRRAEIPAANGHGNARSVAAVQSVLACGGEVGGVRLLSERGCDAVFEEQHHGTDLVVGVPVRFGMGYGLTSPEMPLGVGGRTCFWGGWGGSLVVVDADARLVVAYVMNRMADALTGDLRAATIVAAAYRSLATVS